MLGELYGRLLNALALGAAVLLFALVAGITTDIFLRNLFVVTIRGIDEMSEYALLLMTLMTAPWLLRTGQHVRLDLLLVMVPRIVAWAIEIVGDLTGIAVTLTLAWFGFASAMDSRQTGALVMKAWIFPEWWLLIGFPICMTLLAIEFVFRLQRLLAGPVGPRGDSTSVA